MWRERANSVPCAHLQYCGPASPQNRTAPALPLPPQLRNTMRELASDRESEAAQASIADPGPRPVGVRSTTQEMGLRAVGAALQIIATWAVVHALPTNAAGIYFRGFVISLGFAAVLRANYEIYVAYHIIAARAAATGISDSTLLMQLGRRVLLRSTIASAILLVIASDIDIQAPRLQPALETYLPFVLAIPWVSLSTFIGEALRAANRTLYGTIVGAYVLNISMLLAVAFAPTNGSLTFYAWVFFAGSAIAAALAVVFGRNALRPDWAQADSPIPAAILRAADERGGIGLGRAALLWGPLCILAVAGSASQMAYYSVPARIAMIVDFFLPALNLSGGRGLIGNAAQRGSARSTLPLQLGRTLLVSSVVVAILLAVAPATLWFFGPPYDAQIAIYMILLAVQWANGVGRPAVRQLVASWDVQHIKAAVGTAAISALLVCGITINSYGILATAAASLLGALVINLWAILAALRQRRDAVEEARP